MEAPFVQSFIMFLLERFLPIAVTVILGLVAGILTRFYVQVGKKLTAEQLKALKLFVDAVVKAAEQSGLKLEVLKTGAERKAWAITEIQRLLDEHGIKGISVATIATFIEAALRDGVHKDPIPLLSGEVLDWGWDDEFPDSGVPLKQ